MDFASSTRAAENRTRWRLLRIHLWCPNDLSRLWDRIEWKSLKLYIQLIRPVLEYADVTWENGTQYEQQELEKKSKMKLLEQQQKAFN